MKTKTKTKKIGALTRDYIFPSEGRDMIYRAIDDNNYFVSELRVWRCSDVKTITAKALAEAVESQCRKKYSPADEDGGIFCIVSAYPVSTYLMENGDFMLFQDGITTAYYGRDLVIVE